MISSKINIASLFAFAISLVAFVHNAHAANKPLTIVTEIAPPLQFVNGNELDGQTTRKVRELLTLSGIEAEITPYPWARAYHLAKYNPNTLIYPMVRSPDREQDFQWIGKLLSFKLSVIQLSNGKATPIDSLEKVKTLKLGLMRDDYVHQLLTKEGFVENKHYQLSRELVQLLNQLYTGKIDAMIADLPLLKIIALSQGFEPSRLVSVYSVPGPQIELYLAAGNNTEKAYIDTLSKALKQLNDN